MPTNVDKLVSLEHVHMWFFMIHAALVDDLHKQALQQTSEILQ